MLTVATGAPDQPDRSAYRKYFDGSAARLVYIGRTADEKYWEAHWAAATAAYASRVPRHNFAVRHTVRYVPAGGTVLEGGCGLATTSWHLRRLGYRTVALDFAYETLRGVAQRVPTVRPVAADVRALPLRSASVDAYWSIGVVEHFYDGYERVAREMRRVLKPEGHLFLTFPCMSRLRVAKARLRLYESWHEQRSSIGDFYQFALDDRAVAESFASAGFRLIERDFFLGVSGLAEELGGVGKLLNRSLAPNRRITAIVRAGVDLICRRFTGHCALLVLRKES